ELAGHVVTLREVSDTSGSNYQGRAAVLSVARDGEPLYEMQPEKRFYAVRSMATTEIAIRSSFGGDLYMIIGEETSQGGVTIRGYWNPLVSWIWVGWLVVACGSLLSLSGTSRRKTGHASSVATPPAKGVPAE